MEINEKILIKEAEKDGIEQLAVGAVVVLDNKFLLLERNPQDFLGKLVETPGGKVEEGESLKDALKRELYEETGLSIKKIVKYIDFFDYIAGSGKRTRIFNFLTMPIKNQIKINSKEHTSYLLKKLDQIADEKINISKECLDILRKSLLIKQA